MSLKFEIMKSLRRDVSLKFLEFIINFNSRINWIFKRILFFQQGYHVIMIIMKKWLTSRLTGLNRNENFNHSICIR